MTFSEWWREYEELNNFGCGEVASDFEQDAWNAGIATVGDIDRLQKISAIFARIVVRRTDGTVVLVPDAYALREAGELLRSNNQIEGREK